MAYFFFTSIASEVVINANTDAYYLLPNATINFQKNIGLDARVSWVNDRLIVTGKNLSTKSTATNLFIGQEILSVNNKQLKDFDNNCNFFNWYFLQKNDSVVLELPNGQKITIVRQQLQ